MNYQCVNSGTGEVQSSGIGARWTYGNTTVTDVHPTGVNVQLSAATLPNDFVRKNTRRNTRKGKQTLVITNYAMEYFDVADWSGGGQGSTAARQAKLRSAWIRQARR